MSKLLGKYDYWIVDQDDELVWQGECRDQAREVIDRIIDREDGYYYLCERDVGIIMEGGDLDKEPEPISSN
ncbi:hypothetical protein GZ77_09555 [Endozoicomonas montiporae]|uniref:Uncharacterized protein n=2 Tax=Endozoicomonas montiporae TaxID=1027273 RepID=A0A081N7Z2_9GAMM|nr:hypothetical protein [Endozoicomonas montiporae]AMO55672.1 hypothetical protein EZMO1_1504 [Endozoicomonas montiporae CL-33]KEQ14473.1 hypothetical protein GZ77_08920 [Endozoicomonas montiporae]KEQ14565.1 hypothetical protein GZ77_09555 [Endozoicomonas montiporae]